jgi:hypothetical protein
MKGTAMATNEKPDHILYIVIPGERPEDKKRWVRFGAAWKASKGFSIKIEPAFTLFPPFSDLSLGVCLMPADNDSNGQQSNNRGNQQSRRR